MSRGYNKHQDRLAAIAELGRALARRARSRCELCEESGVRLDPCEVTPLPEEPEHDRAVMLCERCARGVDGGPLDALEWRFLESAAWSTVPAVQVTAVRALRRAADDGVHWAISAVDALYLDPEIEAWVDGASPGAPQDT